MSSRADLRAARQRIGWTLREAARRWGVSHPTIVAWELGRVPAPPEYQRWIEDTARVVARVQKRHRPTSDH